MLADPNAHVSTVLAGEIPVANYFVNIAWATCVKYGRIRWYYRRFCGSNNF